jgi:hypothetical protein
MIYELFFNYSGHSYTIEKAVEIYNEKNDNNFDTLRRSSYQEIKTKSIQLLK